MVGEHIRALKGGRWNHAIDCGDETVIHLAEDGAAPPRVRRSYRPEFIAGAGSVEVVRHRERTFAANEVVARAYSRISEPGLAAVFRDSEAFAEWCVTGRLPAGPPSSAATVPGGAPAAAPAPATAERPVPARPPAAAEASRTAAAPRKQRAPKAKARASAKAAARTGSRATAKARSKAAAKPKARGAKAGRRTRTARRR